MHLAGINAIDAVCRSANRDVVAIGLDILGILDVLGVLGVVDLLGVWLFEAFGCFRRVGCFKCLGVSDVWVF